MQNSSEDEKKPEGVNSNASKNGPSQEDQSSISYKPVKRKSLLSIGRRHFSPQIADHSESEDLTTMHLMQPRRIFQAKRSAGKRKTSKSADSWDLQVSEDSLSSIVQSDGLSDLMKSAGTDSKLCHS